MVNHPNRSKRSKWQPIETAPKDGTRVLVAAGQFVGEAWFCEDDGTWYEQNTHPTDATDGAIWGVTVWQPLPDPPSS